MDHKKWGKSVPYLKENTTMKKPIPVTGDLVQVPGDLVKIHKDKDLKADLFFVDGIPLFLTLSWNICFTAVNHISNRKVETIIKAFKEIYNY